jgi:hypothetical protein
MDLPPGYKWISYDITNIDNCKLICNLLSNNYLEDDKHKFRHNYSPEFIQWFLTSFKSLNIGIIDESTNELVGFISGRFIDLMLNNNNKYIGEVSFLCISKNNRNNKLCPLLIDEIIKHANYENIFEAIATSNYKYPYLLTQVNYYQRFINIKNLIDLEQLIVDVEVSVVENKYILPKLKCGNKKLIKLTNENMNNYIDLCLELYNKYMSKFDCYEIFNRDTFIKTFINNYINVYLLIENNKLLDFISYYSININVLKQNKVLVEGYMYYYTNTSNHLHKMLLMLLYELKNTPVDSFMALDIMDTTDDILDDLKFINTNNDFYYFLFKNDKLRINKNKLAKLIF